MPMRLVRSCALLAVLLSTPDAIRGQTSLAVTGAVSVTNAFDDGAGAERGPTLGLALGQRLSGLLGAEAALSTTIYPMSELIPTCLPTSPPCLPRIIAPGQVVHLTARVVARPAPALTLLAGAGAGRSVSFPEHPTESRPSAVAFEAGGRVHPLSGGWRRLGLGLTVTRYDRPIGDLRWSVTVGVHLGT